MTEPISYFNGEYIPDSQCNVHIAHRGFLRGDSVFDVSRTFNGKVHRLKEHVDRLYRSLTFARIDPGMSIEKMEAVTREVIDRNQPLRDAGGDFVVWQTVVRGYAHTLARITEEAPAIVCVSVIPIKFKGHARDYQTGCQVVFPPTRGYSPQSLDPKVKHYSRMNFSLAELEASDVDPEAHAVLLDTDGNISENTSGNFFIVTDGVIRTPTDRAILQGVARLDILELAKKLGMPTSEEDLQPYDAYTADEAFLTNTIYCVLPVARIDKRPIRGEVPGPITQRLLAAWSEMVGMDIADQALQRARLEDDGG
jgi:branched-chain amino acid aminotransferase